MDSSFATAISAVDQSKHAQQILDAQTDAIYARLLPIIVANLIFTSAAVPLALWDLASGVALTCWILANFAIVMVLVVLYMRYRFVSKKARKAADGVYLSAAFFLIGAYWSVVMSYYLVMTEGMLYHLYVYIYWGAMGTLAVSLLSESLSAFLSFFLPSSLLMIGFALAKATTDYFVLAAISAIGIVTLVWFAVIRGRALTETLQLRFAITDLAIEASKQRDTAEHANIAKSKFLAAASHDLRQPLHALTLLTSALSSNSLTDDVRSIANGIQAAVGSLEKLFNALLDVSRLDAGVMKPERQHFELDLFLRRVTDEYTLEAATKELDLSYEKSGMVVCSDPLMLESILRNYLSNAIRYTQSGTIRISCLEIDAGIRINVRDSGIGIPISMQHDIFSEFYQIDNPERDRSKGLGLGLAIVRRIAKLLDHGIGVESELGCGACFYVVVPRGDPTMVAKERSSVAQSADLAKLCVTVIDDDALVRESMRTLLTAWNCKVVIAADAEEAIRESHATFYVPDVLIVDFRLRNNLTGLDAIRRFNEEYMTSFKALIVSGDTAPERLREVASSGYAMSHKPIQPAALRSFLSGVLRAKNVTG
jgi:signal transduction histidine kinase